jgi:glycine/D-amino acid oxidase-like deaminating enzyme
MEDLPVTLERHKARNLLKYNQEKNLAFNLSLEDEVSRRFWRKENRSGAILRACRQNYWFHSLNLAKMPLNPALNKEITADIAIIGGGFTGLASAYHLISNNPEKNIVLLEATACGYGASGRNGGFADTGMHNLWEILEREGPEKAREVYDITLEGLDAIRHFVTAHDVDCDFSARGSIELANEPAHMEELEDERRLHKEIGLEARLINKEELQKIIRSERYEGGLWYPYGATVNPFKLARGMKRVVEEKGVEIYEKTPVLHVRYGNTPVAQAERGRVNAKTMVIATDGYSPMLGLFKRQVLPMCAYLIATEPLSEKQLASIGWTGREKLSDLKPVFDYFHLTPDNRIIFGGAGLRYLFGGRVCGKPHKRTLEKVKQSLFETFPQLEGLKITHGWGGTLGMSYDFLPSIGTLDHNGHVLYAVAYSGEGTLLTQVAGKIVNHLYRKEENHLTRMFIVNKPIPKVWPEPFIYLGFQGFSLYYKHFGRRPRR